MAWNPDIKGVTLPLSVLKQSLKQPHTLNYPVEKRQSIPGYRGFHVNDLSQCVGCGNCQDICMNEAIDMVEATGDAVNPKNASGLVPRIDYGRCCWCGLCADVCGPYSLRLEGEYTYVSADPDSFLYVPKDTKNPKERRTMQRLQWGAVLFVVWLGLTNSLQIQEVIAGLIVSAVIVWLAIPRPTPGTENKPWSLVGLLLYLPVFLKALVLANLDVARRVLDPRLPISPGIVRIRTTLEHPYQRLILANSITLTPGTVTLETDGADLYVHWIDVRETDPEAAGETIKGELERAIRRI